MGGSTTIATSETRIEALKFQSSAYGVVLPVVYGVTRIPGNLMWYGGFKAIPHTTTQSQGGKGGSVKTQQTTYTYTAAVMMGLCEGDIAGVAQVWRGKTLYQGGNAPSQILTASQNYTVPVGGGSVTVTNASAYAADVSVVSPSGGGENGNDSFQLSEGYHYTRVGGTYTFPSSAGGWGLEGLTLAITYQYTQAGASQTSLQQLGLSLAKGTVGQSVWSYLTTSFPAQAIGYSGIAYVYSSAYDLGTSASIDNHNFEVQAQMAYTISSSVPDADPSQVGYDITTNYRYGVAGFPATKLGTTGQWSNYCRAAGLLMSPAFTEQDSAAAVLKKLTDLTNTALVWSEGVLKFVPYGDTTITGNGATYTPNTTPLYDLTDDHFLDKDVPIRMKRKPQSDAYNQIQIEFLNRANQYNVEITEAKDQANIDTYGLRSPDVLKAHWICDATVARTVAQLMLQRALYIRNTYEFKLPWNFVLLEPMDLVTLTDATLGLSKTPVRITEVTESEDGELMFTAEDFPQGSATATLYPTQSGSGFSHNYNVAPGSVSAPFIFEAPGALTQNGLEVYVAATGLDGNWGGCHVWVSLDGSNYKQVGTINGGSRYGTLNAAATSGGTIGVTLLKGALVSGSAADATALNTLCYIGGALKEFLAYQTATLGGALQYTLASNVRGVYGTPASAHSSGDPFVRIDDAVAKSGPIDLGYIGKTIHVKLTSFNVYGGGEETLASVTDYTYTITGYQLYGNAGAAALQGFTNASSDNLLTVGEKGPIILEYTKVTAEQSGIDAQASAYGITTEKTAYDAAVSALTTYLGTLTSPVAWNNLTGDTTIVGTTFRSTWASLYSTRQTLLNKIDQLAGTVAVWTGVSSRPTNLANLTGAENLGVNLVNSANWVIGSSGQQSGGGMTTWPPLTTTGITNVISLDAGPDGALRPCWVATSNSAAGTDPSGGINDTSTFPVDPTKAYRVAVWVYHQGTMDGSTYLGVGANQVDDIPSGTQNSNPYQVFYTSSTYTAGRWYLFVGYVLPTGYAGGQLNLSGVYDGTTGVKVISGADFKFHAGQTTLNIRAFRYYTGGSGRVTKFTHPMVHMIDGTEPSLAAMLTDAVLGRANSAYTQAVSAQSAADAANTALTNIASDSILSPSEKPSVVQDYNVIIGEQSGLDTQATAYGITTEKTTYDNAVSALTSYLSGLSGWNTIPGSDVAIVGSTFRSTFAAVYTAKQALVNKIAQVAGTLSSWAGVSGAGKPADNAGAVVSLVNAGNMTITGNTVQKTSGSNSWSDGSVYSKDSFTGGAFVSFVAPQTIYAFMIGLNADPTADLNYTSLDYSMFCDGGAGLTAYESGSGYALGTYAVGDVLAVTYDGIVVKYWKNGNVLRTVTVSITSNLFLDSSFHHVGAKATNIQFGPMTKAGAILGYSLTDSSGLTLGDYQVLNNQNNIIMSPNGGFNQYGGNPQAGAIKIRLPQSWTNTMMRFYVEVYEYNTDSSVTYEVGGYNYQATPSWYNFYARAVGNPANVRPVYFGHDGTYCCIWIGNGGGSYYYPVIRVRDFVAGYQNYSRAQWETGWAITMDTTGAINVTGTVAKPVPGGTLSGADSVSTTLIDNAAVNQLYSLYDASGVGRSNAA